MLRTGCGNKVSNNSGFLKDVQDDLRSLIAVDLMADSRRAITY